MATRRVSEDARAGLDWSFIVHSATWGFAILVCGIVLSTYVAIAIARPQALFQDTVLYYEATATWLVGEDPWLISHNGIDFGGIPPTLLLNLPLQPFGPMAAFVFWPVAGLLGMLVVIRRFDLSPLWLLWPPVIEGWTAGSPDYALLGLVVVGGGAVAAVAKPYSVPALIAQRRWRAVVVGAIIGLVTVPILPWGTFIADREIVLGAFLRLSASLSAWGSPLLVAATAIALLRLGRDGLELATPGLWPHSQMHYAVFSIRAAARSPLLAIGFAIPVPGAPAVAIIGYAIAVELSAWVENRASGQRGIDHVASTP